MKDISEWLAIEWDRGPGLRRGGPALASRGGKFLAPRASVARTGAPAGIRSR